MTTAIKQEIERRFLALMHADEFGPLNTDYLGDVLMVELEHQWYTLPDSTRAVLLGVGTELKRHHAVGVLADTHAAQIVADMKGGPQ